MSSLKRQTCLICCIIIMGMLTMRSEVYLELAAAPLASMVFQFEGMDKGNKNSIKPFIDLNLIN